MTTEMDRVCERYGIKMQWTSGPTHRRDDEGWEHHGGTVRLYHSGPTGMSHAVNVPFKVGMGIDPTEVSAADVVSSLVLDASLGRESFEEFCSSLGYDTDSRKAHASWEQCRKQVHVLDELLSSEAMRDDITSAVH